MTRLAQRWSGRARRGRVRRHTSPRCRAFIAGLLAAAAIGACASERPAGADRDADGEAIADTGRAAPDTARPDTAGAALACEGLEHSLLRTRATRSDLAGLFGPADSVHATTEPNRHTPGVTDSLFTVFYSGLVVDIHKPGGGDDLPSHAEIRDDRYLADRRLGMGASESTIVAVLGEPTDRQPAALVYDCGVGADQPVRFVLDDGRVTRIEIEYYVD